MSQLQEKETFEAIWTNRSILLGIAALLEQQSRELCFTGDELFGIGKLLRKISEEIAVIEEGLTR